MSDEVKPPPGRMTVTDTVYHQLTGFNPTAAERRFSRFVESDEQPYSRRVTVPRHWVRLDPGWLGGVGVGMLYLSNDGATSRTTLPTPEQREADDGLVVEVAASLNDEGTMAIAFARLRPGESLRFEPTDPGRLMLRCSGGQPTRVLITLFPA